MVSEGIIVLPELYHFDVPALLGKVKRGGNFKTKTQVDPSDGRAFLPYVDYPVSRLEAELITSWPVDDAPYGSQLWHRDTEEGNKCLRAMVYLTDVDEDCGPFCYVPGSQGVREYVRMTDDEFARVVPRDRWVTYIGPKGTTILFDITGYHRGLPNRKGKREVLCFTYHP